jgi:hypothetical protein
VSHRFQIFRHDDADDVQHWDDVDAGGRVDDVVELDHDDAAAGGYAINVRALIRVESVEL